MNERQAAKNGTDDERELEVPSFPISCVFIRAIDKVAERWMAENEGEKE